MESDTDRSWLVFLIGVVVILPVALGLARDAEQGLVDPAAGLWGDFIATYAERAFGTVGAWLMLALAVSALAAATLRWNPDSRASSDPPRRVREPGTGNREPKLVRWRLREWPRKGSASAARKGTLPAGTPADVATTLAPTPEEMPAIDPSLMRDARETARDDEDDEHRRAARSEEEARRNRRATSPPSTPSGSPPRSTRRRWRSMSRATSCRPRRSCREPPVAKRRARKARARPDGHEAHGRAAHVPRRGRVGRPHDGARRHAVRDRAGRRREGAAVREPRERSRARHARAEHPRRRADSRSRRRRRRGAEPQRRDGDRSAS